MVRILALCCLLSLTWACKTKKSAFDQTMESVITVGPEKVPCTGVAPQSCYQIKTAEDDDWTLHHGEIEGFDYQPGYSYRLRVWKEEIADPPADGASWRYVLVKEISKAPAATTHSRLHDIWVLTSLDGEELDAADSRPTLELFPAEGRLAGTGGCNTIFGHMTVDGNAIRFSGLGATKMYCDGLMQTENKFLRLLQQVDHFELRNLQLHLLQEEKVLMSLRKVD